MMVKFEQSSIKDRINSKLVSCCILIFIIQLVGLAISQVYIQSNDEWNRVLTSTALTEKEKIDSYFYDDFEHGTQNWNLGNGWDIGSMNGNSFLVGEGHYFASLNDVWKKPGLKARFMLNKGTMHFCIRTNNEFDGFNRYAIGVSSNNIYCFKQEGNNNFINLKPSFAGPSNGIHHNC